MDKNKFLAELGQRIKEKRIEQDMSQEQLAQKVGYKSRSSINKIELGKSDISQTMIKMIATALNTTPSYIMGWESDMPSNILPLPQTRPVPMLGTIACGEPILAEQNIEAYVNVNADIPADFALKCKGDSMINARIFDGDIVYIRRQADVDDGEIAAVLIDTEATLKRVHKYPNKLVLSPCNPMYDDLIYTAEQLDSVRILGKAVAFTSTIR
jgi:repressor LexA